MNKEKLLNIVELIGAIFMLFSFLLYLKLGRYDVAMWVLIAAMWAWNARTMRLLLNAAIDGWEGTLAAWREHVEYSKEQNKE